MRDKDFTSGLVFFLVACGVCFYAFRTSLGSLTNPGPGLFAFMSGGVLFVLSLVLMLKSWRLPKSPSAEKSREPLRRRNILILASAMVIYSLVLNYLGYIPSTLLLMIVFFRGIEPQPWWVVMLGSSVSAGFSYLLFHVWLKIDLPIGILGV